MTTVPEFPPRPERIPGTECYAGPDGKAFLWGPVEDVHRIGDIQVVEFRADRSRSAPVKWPEHGQTYFHAYVNGVDTGTYYDTLDEAVIGALANKYDGPDSPAAPLIFRMIGMEDV